MEIIKSNFTSNYLNQLSMMFEDMWGETIPFDPIKLGLELPCPLLVIDENLLIGGLSFTAYEKPDVEGIGVWINALYVDEKYRLKGIGLRLIQHAEELVLEFGYHVLYANTNVPQMYLRNGWIEVAINGDDRIMKKCF